MCAHRAVRKLWLQTVNCQGKKPTYSQSRIAQWWQPLVIVTALHKCLQYFGWYISMMMI